tara:strand:- start:393 stop:1598 length:1206 start_codon:yes stop_codon:yes gene_type:complete
MKVLNKKGSPSYKEKKLVTQLQEVVDKKIAEDPNFANTFKPATNFDELKKLHKKYVGDEIDFEEIKSDDDSSEINQEHKSFRDNLVVEKTNKPNAFDGGDMREEYSFIDPLNREEPIVRDYVTNEEFPNENQSSSDGVHKTTFGEPMSFKDSFEIPTEQTAQGQKESPFQQAKQQSQPKAQAKPPINPSYGDMTANKQKKSTKKFAKYIVEATCVLAEKGFVWFANKDINDSKLAEYEVNDEMDLSLLVTLEDGQEASVKQFFQIQCMKAEQLAQIQEDERQDLAEALALVMDEKGIAPTPTQELMLVGFSILGRQVITLIALKSSTSSLLNQLRAMREGEGRPSRQRPQPQPTQKPTPEPQPTPEPKAPTQPTSKAEMVEGDFDNLDDAVIIDNPINTLE